jgi:hypothetical protein
MRFTQPHHTMEHPPSPFRIPASPVTPLQQISPDRINQQRIPASPTLPNQLLNADTKLPRQSIDVQSKVAFLNSLTQAGSQSRQQGLSTHAALQRALLGREEAESALRHSQAQLAEAEVRQRKISERLESMMEDLQSVKERQAHERQVFEKEVRKARKDAFRAGSALVKMQEDLKESRVEVRNLKAENQHEKFEKEKSKQEAFERAYTLAGVLEEMEALREKLRAMEAAREIELLEQQSSRKHRDEEEEGLGAEKQNLEVENEEEDEEEEEEGEAAVVGVQDEAEDGLLAEQQQQDEQVHAALLTEAQDLQDLEVTDQNGQPRQNRFERISIAELHSPEPSIRTANGSRTNHTEQLDQELRQDDTTDLHEQLCAVDAELQWEKKLRQRAEEMVHFLQMECQFEICACRVAEKNGKRFVHDRDYHELALARSIEAEQGERCEPPEELSGDVDLMTDGMLQPKEDMFTISGQIQHVHEQLIREESHASPTRCSTQATSEAPSPSSTDQSSTSAMESPRAGPFKPCSMDSPSSPTIVSAEDMTYQPPNHPMLHPNPSCTASRTSAPTSPPARSPSASPYPLTPGFKTPQRQGLRVLQAQTTTMMVPLKDNDDVFCPAPGTPGTPVSREAALAQIRARRDRARSVAMSSSRSAPGSARRGLVGGLRDISAPGRF